MDTLANLSTQQTGAVETTASGVSWSAIIAGAFAAASLSLILLMLGVGLGLSSVSPWSNAAASATTIGAVAILWLIFTHVAASGLGGYLAGRLRIKWAGIHTNEVYFRDTAHGFLAWAVASVVASAVLGSAMASIVAGGAKAVGTAAATVAGSAVNGVTQQQGQAGNPLAYFADSMFRSDHPTSSSDNASGVRGEAGRILATSLQHGTVDPADKTYLARLISASTGVTPTEAERRIDDSFGRAKAETARVEAAAKEAADAARRTAARSMLWMFIALLCGAFVASLAATWGGKRRDDSVTR